MEFSLKDLGQLDYFVGIEVTHLSNGYLMLSQGKYIRDLFLKTNMASVKGIDSLMASSIKLSKIGSIQVSDPTHFRSIVEALQYATMSRPETYFAVNKVFQFLSNPLKDHWKAVKIILRYLQASASHGLLLNPANRSTFITITCFCDVDWASDPNDSRYTSGACIFLGPNIVSWWDKKKTLVARSSDEAEYRSLDNGITKIL